MNVKFAVFFAILGVLLGPSAQAQTAQVNVAVLPFANAANDKATDYFPGALTDEEVAKQKRADRAAAIIVRGKSSRTRSRART